MDPNIVALGVALNAGAGAEYGMSTAIGIAIAWCLTSLSAMLCTTVGNGLVCCNRTSLKNGGTASAPECASHWWWMFCITTMGHIQHWWNCTFEGGTRSRYYACQCTIIWQSGWCNFCCVPADWCPCGVLKSSHAMACDNWQFHYVFIYYVQIGILTYLHSVSGDSTVCINVMAEEWCPTMQWGLCCDLIPCKTSFL